MNKTFHRYHIIWIFNILQKQIDRMEEKMDIFELTVPFILFDTFILKLCLLP